jgi:hypothetical protein
VHLDDLAPADNAIGEQAVKSHSRFRHHHTGRCRVKDPSFETAGINASTETYPSLEMAAPRALWAQCQASSYVSCNHD